MVDCRQILQAFELSQARMLQMKNPGASDDILLEIEQMENLFTGMHTALAGQANFPDKNYLLIIRQLERLLKFTKELRGQITRLSGVETVTEKEILFIFERQFKFKVIFNRHLSDFARFF
jgi:hypothetical protein